MTSASEYLKAREADIKDVELPSGDTFRIRPIDSLTFLGMADFTDLGAGLRGLDPKTKEGKAAIEESKIAIAGAMDKEKTIEMVNLLLPSMCVEPIVRPGRRPEDDQSTDHLYISDIPPKDTMELMNIAIEMLDVTDISSFREE